MRAIDKIDKNLAVKKKIERDDLVFYNCLSEPFEIFGLIKPTDEVPYFIRMDKGVADGVSLGVSELNAHSAGGRVRFKTNSPFVAIHANMHVFYEMSHFPLTGSTGFDLYERINGRENYIRTFIPPYDVADDNGYESIIELGDNKMREFTINFPLYCGVKALFIGVEKDAVIEKCTQYTYKKPVVYYGSSITQGGCASRPGNSYQAMISRKYDCDYINLGFSGNAKGEDKMAEYIAGLDMSIFVYDYDHNAPNPEHLKNTHERMFNIIRKSHPHTPVVMISRPYYKKSDDADVRYEIIKNTYDNAVKNGDKNVYLIDGRAMMHFMDEDCVTVDDCHPNDIGFYCMAQKVGDVVGEILNKL